MPRPNGSFLAQLRGTMASGANPWTCSMAFGTSDQEAQGFAQALHQHFGENDGLYEALQNMLNTQDNCIELTVYKYGAQGTVDSQGRVSVNLTGISTNSHAKSTACVITLRTAVNTRSGRGRIYLPATGANVQDNGLFGTAYLQYALDSIDALAYDPILDTPLAVYSGTTGVLRNVVRADCDRTPDRQEHRERNITAGRLQPTRL